MQSELLINHYKPYFSATSPLKRASRSVLYGLVLWFVSLSVWVPQPVQAAAVPFDLSITPSRNYLQALPGSQTLQQVSLEQRGSQTLAVELYLVDFTADGETGLPKLLESSSVRWIKVTEPSQTTQTSNEAQDTKSTSLSPFPNAQKLTSQPFLINPGQTSSVTLSLQPPSESREKEYLVTLLAVARPATPDGEIKQEVESTSVSGVVASNLIIFVSTNPNSRSHLELKSLKMPWILDSLQPLTFTTSAVNPGPHAVVATGSATLKNWRNQTIATWQVYPDMVLSGASRQLRAQTSTQSVDPSTFTYRPWFWLGKYTVEVTLESPPEVSANSEKSETVTRSISSQVVVLPISIIIIFLLSIAAWVSSRRISLWLVQIGKHALKKNK